MAKKKVKTGRPLVSEDATTKTTAQAGAGENQPNNEQPTLNTATPENNPDHPNLPNNPPVVGNTSGTDQLDSTAGGVTTPGTQPTVAPPDNSPTDEEKLEAAEASRAASQQGNTEVPTGPTDATPQHSGFTPAQVQHDLSGGIPANAEIIHSGANLTPSEDKPLQGQIVVDARIYTDTRPSGIVKDVKAGEFVDVIGKETSAIQNEWYKIRWENPERTDEKGRAIKLRKGEDEPASEGYIPAEYITGLTLKR